MHVDEQEQAREEEMQARSEFNENCGVVLAKLSYTLSALAEDGDEGVTTVSTTVIVPPAANTHASVSQVRRKKRGAHVAGPKLHPEEGKVSNGCVVM
jgi:hypothetical protein